MGKKLATCDCETSPFRAGRYLIDQDRMVTADGPFIWGFFTGKSYHEYRTTWEFIEGVKRFKGPIYAHNGGKFDYHFVLDYAERNQEIKVINGRISKFKIGNATFLDSYNILPVPLKALQKDDFEYWKLEPDVRDKYMPEIQRYLKSDCTNLYEMVSDFRDVYGTGLTLAGAAFKFWLELSGRARPKSDKAYFDKFKPFYFGGRVECFESGIIQDTVKMYDIVSAYPRGMMEDHPISGRHFKTCSPTDDQMRRCVVEVECHSAGALPYRWDDNSISFPTGRGTFFCSGWELIAGLETGTVKNVNIKMAYVFRDTINFQDYVNHFFALKQHATNIGDAAQRVFAKLFLNSLYGKWAVNVSNYSDYKLTENVLDDVERFAMYSEGWRPCEIMGDVQIWAKPTDDETGYLNVVTAASITGWVRAYLWRSLCSVERPLYCDTDSIACRDGSRLDLGGELGQWELEKTGHEMAIGGKKMYALFGDGKPKIASKGVKLSAEQIKQVAQGKTIKYINDVQTFSISSPPRFIDRNVRMTNADTKKYLNDPNAEYMKEFLK